jgi:hypothetical protein
MTNKTTKRAILGVELTSARERREAVAAYQARELFGAELGNNVAAITAAITRHDRGCGCNGCGLMVDAQCTLLGLLANAGYVPPEFVVRGLIRRGSKVAKRPASKRSKVAKGSTRSRAKR